VRVYVQNAPHCQHAPLPRIPYIHRGTGQPYSMCLCSSQPPFNRFVPHFAPVQSICAQRSLPSRLVNNKQQKRVLSSHCFLGCFLTYYNACIHWHVNDVAWHSLACTNHALACSVQVGPTLFSEHVFVVVQFGSARTIYIIYKVYMQYINISGIYLRSYTVLANFLSVCRVCVCVCVCVCECVCVYRRQGCGNTYVFGLLAMLKQTEFAKT